MFCVIRISSFRGEVHILSHGVIMDFDDTLVESTVFFETARMEYADLMAGLGFPRDEVLAVLDRKDIENVRQRGGFLKECFPLAMAQTYDHFCGLSGLEPDTNIRRRAEGIGWWVFDQRPVPVPGAGEVLEEMSAAGLRLVLATKGDPAIQWRRIGESGLREYFNGAYVLRDKTSREYQRISRWQGIDPARSWVVGNSIKSDINPGMEAGFNCIYIPNSNTWHFEMEEPRGRFSTLGDLREVPGLVIPGARGEVWARGAARQ